MYKTLSISVIFHITALLLFSWEGLLKPSPSLTIPKEIVINAEIVTDQELYNKQDSTLKSETLNSFQGMVHGKTQVSKVKTQKSRLNIKERDSNGQEIKVLSEIFKDYKELDDKTTINSTDTIKDQDEEIKSYFSSPDDASVAKNLSGNKQESDLLRVIRDSIEKAKVYPPLARKRGIEGKTVIRFRIRPNGEVDEVKIVKGSGFEILDRISVETIRKSAPLPYVRDWIEIPLIFRLE
jgi:protein TonB